ncbi:MAG TPA: RNA methyltransferase [Cryomorphaceae bacterium]|nr:RNA methyltransferase [Cryomorphaceae bacterium]
MIPHPNLVAGVLEVLERTFGQRLYADRVVDQVLRANKRWGARDRAFVAEHSYELVRWWGLIWHLHGTEPVVKRKQLKELFDTYWTWRSEGMNVPADLDVALAQSYAPWFAERASAELGTDWPVLATALNRPAHVVLRANTLKTTREAVLERLTAEGVDAALSDVAPDALVLAKRPRLQHLESFKDGWYEVHDGGSQRIAAYLDPQPGDRILDGCSGAGGKADRKSALAGNQAEIRCMDVEAYKLGEAEKRALRAGVNGLRTELIRSPRDVQRHSGWANKMLLDVPCSGTGVIRRDVDTKWKLQPEHLERTRETQYGILRDYSEALQSGGTLVYATCSILRSENEDQVRRFIDEKNGAYTLREEVRISPEHPHSDGYYVAVLHKH